MSSSDPSDPDVVDPLADDPLAFLYEPGDEDEDQDSTADHPGYGSLMGIGVRKGARSGKAMAIVLDELEAQRAAEVMEINAGQLMTNPDRSNRHAGFLGLGPLDAAEEGVEEEDLAETLAWDAEEDDGAEWKPENPLAGSGIAEEDDDADWAPVNPLAGTQFEDAEDDEDWAPVNPLAGTEYEEEDDDPDWAPADPLAGTGLVRADEWDTPPAEAESVDPGMVAPLEEQAWSAPEQVDPQPAASFEEVEWDAPQPEVPVEEELAADPVAAAEWQAPADEPLAEIQPAFEPEALPEAAFAPVEEAESAEQPVFDEPAFDPAPIRWEALLSKRLTRAADDAQQLDWGEFAAEKPAFPQAIEPELPAAEPTEPEPAPQANDDWSEIDEPVAAAEDSWEADEAETVAPGWSGVAAEEALEEIAAEAPDPIDPLPQLPEQIEILRFPAPPVPEVPHHSLRARVMKSSEDRAARPSLSAAFGRWLRRQFVQQVLPRLRQLLDWAKAKWAEFAARNRNG